VNVKGFASPECVLVCDSGRRERGCGYAMARMNVTVTVNNFAPGSPIGVWRRLGEVDCVIYVSGSWSCAWLVVADYETRVSNKKSCA
jgi:hypothetical protein